MLYSSTVFEKITEVPLKRINYEKKAELLSDVGFMKNVRDILRAESANFYLHESGVVIPTNMTFDTSQELRCFFNDTRREDFEEAEKLIRAENKRTSRLKSRISLFLNCDEPTNFITLTFCDKILQNSTPTTRRRYVTRYLKSQSKYYVANIDFGEKNGREHYHAVVLGRINLDPWKKYGHIFAESVGNRKELTRKNVPNRYKSLDEKTQKALMLRDTEKKLAKYVAKLTNHAIKETTKRSVIIYSKDVPTPHGLERITDYETLKFLSDKF